ncbi:ENR1 protein, partial [Drymodes brunneopygia]|nr:ENR1 protein [Drymodes brunneopygia]
QNQKETNPLESDKNLFVDLAERISRQVNLTNCWVCGGTLTSEHWPWRGVSIGPLEILQLNNFPPPLEILQLNNFPPTTRDDNEIWLLSNTVIGEECLWRKS